MFQSVKWLQHLYQHLNNYVIQISTEQIQTSHYKQPRAETAIWSPFFLNKKKQLSRSFMNAVNHPNIC